MPTLQIVGTTIDFDTDWPEFRKWIDGTYANLRLAWIDNGAAYIVVAQDASVFRTVGINKTEPPSAYQIDFDANFKQLGDQPFEPRDQYGNAVFAPSPYAYTPDGARFVGYLYDCAPGVTTRDEIVTQAIKIQGGSFWVKNKSGLGNTTMGDRVTLSVVDVDNILGYGPGTVLSEYVKDVPVVPWAAIQVIEAQNTRALTSRTMFSVKPLGGSRSHTTMRASLGIYLSCGGDGSEGR